MLLTGQELSNVSRVLTKTMFMGTLPLSKLWLEQHRACDYVTLAVNFACASMLGVHCAHEVEALQTWSTGRDAHVRRCEGTGLSVRCKGCTLYACAVLQYILELLNIPVSTGFVKSFKLDHETLVCSMQTVNNRHSQNASACVKYSQL